MAVNADADDRGPADAKSLGSRSATAPAKRINADHADSSAARIAALIEQLGSPRFSDRRAAANELTQIGPEAFDQLQAATDAADLEIAASAQYLLQRINVRWARGDDAEAVRRLLRNYGDRDASGRERIVTELGELSDGQGVAALCRITRFDRSPRVSRQAAAAVIHPSSDDAQQPSVEPELIERELGPSTRLAAQWLRQYQLQLGDPAASVPGWEKLIEEEADRLDRNEDDTSASIVSDLLWNLAEVDERLGETAALMGVIDRIVSINREDSERTVWRLLKWLLDRKAWNPLDQFVAKYDAQIRQTKPSLYLLAVARAAQDQNDLADRLADEALKLDSRSDLESISAAQIVSAEGHFEWAVREYRQVLGDNTLESAESVWACVLLSNLLQDYAEYQQAADALQPLAKKLRGEGDFPDKYQKFQRIFEQWEVDLPDAHVIRARYHFLRACYFAQQRDWPAQRKQLSLAIGHDPEDADVLIAMYRIEEADDAWRAETRKRIHTLADRIEQNLNSASDDTTIANLCNQWAWLVSNTEGDYDKAIRYSRRSLELERDTPSFLDTLGRCYFAAGDLERAVKYQRQAVRLIPHMQVMRRQLAEFEKSLAEKP